MAIALFPLSEGETIDGNIGRYAEFVGLKSTMMLRSRLFGHICAPCTRLPSGIAHLAEQARDYWGMGAEEIIKNHTEYRYITMMASRKFRWEVFLEMLNQPAGRSMSTYILRTTGERVIKFRYCEECLAEWRERGIVPYWRIDHQLPGVYSCFIHSNVLKVAMQAVEGCRGLDPTVLSSRCHCDPAVLQRSSSAEKNAAEKVAERSAQRRTVIDGAVQMQKYYDLLRDAGFIRKDSKIKRSIFVARCLGYFGREYCYLAALNADKVLAWLDKVVDFNGVRPAIHPFVHIAVEEFLDHCGASPRLLLFENGRVH